MKIGRLAALAVFSAATAGFSAPALSASPPEGAFLREDGNYWMRGPHHDYIVGPASAYSRPVSVDIRIAPPAPRREVVPVGRPGHTWVPGYWKHRHNRYEWVSGHWVRDRPGYYYEAPRWVQRGDRWILTEGRWERGHRDRHAAWGDRDRDGVPNRYDRDRDNDGVRNRYDHDRDNDGVRDHRDRDRDGDGVANRHDSRPDNPRRY